MDDSPIVLQRCQSQNSNYLKPKRKDKFGQKPKIKILRQTTSNERKSYLIVNILIFTQQRLPKKRFLSTKLSLKSSLNFLEFCEKSYFVNYLKNVLKKIGYEFTNNRLWCYGEIILTDCKNTVSKKTHLKYEETFSLNNFFYLLLHLRKCYPILLKNF